MMSKKGKMKTKQKDKQKNRQNSNDCHNDRFPTYKYNKRVCYIWGIAIIICGVILSILKVFENTVAVIVISISLGAFCMFLLPMERDLNDWYNNHLPGWYKFNKWFCYIFGSAIIIWGIIASVTEIIANGFSSTTMILIILPIVMGANFIFVLAKCPPTITLLLGDISEDMEKKLQEQKKKKQQNKLKSKNKKK